MTDRTQVDERGVIVAETRLVRGMYCTCKARKVKDCTCVPRGWRGHVAVTFPRPIRAERAAARAARPTTAGKRGPVATSGNGAWSMSERSLSRAAARHADQVNALEQVARTAATESVLTFADGTTATVLSGSQVHYRDRAWSVREWARRSAIAGLALAQ